jgi:hypothetical protein
MRTNLGLASLSLFVLTGAAAAQTQRAPSIAGTYRLVSRVMPDGSTLLPPMIDGLMTYTAGYRNFNIHWTNAAGKAFSVSYAASYELTPKQYREKSIFFLVNDEIGGKGVNYDLSGPSGASPVMVEGRAIGFQLPLHGEPALVFDGNNVTATAMGPFGTFVDHWERVP